MLSLGDGVALAGLCGVTLTVIHKVFPPKTNGHMLKVLCDERSGAIQEDIKEIKETQIKIFEKVDKL